MDVIPEIHARLDALEKRANETDDKLAHYTTNATSGTLFAASGPTPEVQASPEQTVTTSDEDVAQARAGANPSAGLNPPHSVDPSQTIHPDNM